MITIKDVAKHAGVSVATVSYVLNDLHNITPEVKERVLDSVKELNYIPNAVARRLRVKRSQMIGLIVSDISNSFYPDMVKGCEDIADARDYTVLVFNTNEKHEYMQKAICRLKEQRVDGIIIASALSSDKEMIEDLLDQNYPVVLAQRKIDGLDVNCVVADQYNAVVSSMRYLISIGHKKISFCLGIDGSSVNDERIKAYKEMMEEAGFDVVPESFFDGKGTYEDSYRAMKKMLSDLAEDSHPTAVLASNDISAIGIIDAAQDLGLQIPRDLAVVGFGDWYVSKLRGIELTTVRIPRYEMGQIATQILIDAIENNLDKSDFNEYVLPTQLIVRKTS